MQNSLPSIRLQRPEEGAAAQELILELIGEPISPVEQSLQAQA